MLPFITHPEELNCSITAFRVTGAANEAEAFESDDEFLEKHFTFDNETETLIIMSTGDLIEQKFQGMEISMQARS